MVEKYESELPASPALRVREASGGGSGGMRGLAPKKLVIRSTATLLVLAVLGGGYWFATRSSSSGPARAAGPPAPPVTVSHPLERQIVEWDDYTGQFAAVDYVELRARVSGYLDSIHFTDGQIVKKGELMGPRAAKKTMLAKQVREEINATGRVSKKTQLALEDSARMAEEMPTN